MQPDIQAKTTITRVALKEISLFFASPIAYLFLATFAAVTLFVFFWGEAFFSRNIADVRPMFEWMPVLLIFLTASLTMRLWSEERRTGTLEHVLTQAAPLWHFVVGKFVGCVFLLIVALIITLPLPITVALIGDLDWGPVWAGYLATLLLGATYLSIGLFVSARSDNQIVSLISACALSGVFYLIGTSTITNLFSNQTAQWLQLLGTGSRFEAITRGVIDLRDLYYYLSLVVVFLTLNTLVLEKQRWVTKVNHANHRRWKIITALLVANALGVNLWLGQLSALRVDATQGNQYSISPATKGYLSQLQEPLLLRGYFSNKTHPLLAPLVPQLRDLIKEYHIAGDGKVRVEFIDPLSEPELEKEANQKYAIKPTPFQVADRYQSSIVSSYFNVLVQYGDEHQVLGFRDLIEVQALSESDIDVQLRNPEHDLTSAIKKVLKSYQSGGNLFDTVKGKLDFTAYVSADNKLPKELQTFKKEITQTLQHTKSTAGERFSINWIEPDAPGSNVGEQIAEQYGFSPMATSLFSDQRFYFYMLLSKDDQLVQIPLDDISADGFKRNLDTAIKRFATGFTKTVALVAPKPATPQSPYAPAPQGPSFSQLQGYLGTELNIEQEDLSDGNVSANADILVLAAPKELDEKQLFAIDQFLMQGGTVIAATSAFASSFNNQGLILQKYTSGLNQWLEHHGLSIAEKLVMDTQNSAFPIPVTRDVGGFQLQEMRMLDYPYFIDVRNTGLNQDNLITSQLPQLTLTWASPITVDTEKQQQRTITPLIHSSNNAWLSDSLDIMPKSNPDGTSGFTPQGERKQHLLGVVSSGKFVSYFAGKDSPILQKQTTNTSVDNPSQTNNTESTIVSSVIEHSPESAKIILFSSNDFLTDQVNQLASSAQQSQYLNAIQLATNAIDWSLEDTGLLSIRSRGHFNRTLPPMEHSNQLFWEYMNYALAAIALIIIALFERHKRHSKQRRYSQLLAH